MSLALAQTNSIESFEVTQQGGKTVDWLEQVSDAQYDPVQAPTASGTPDAVSASGAQTTPAQRLFGDIAPKLAELTDNVLFRDVEFLVSALLLPLFFLTPVLYPLSDPQIARRDWVLDLIHWGNPLSPVVEALRDPLFYGRLPGLGDTVYTVVAAVAALALGAFVFNRVDDQIAVEV